MARVQGFLALVITVSILWTSLFVSETIGQPSLPPTPCNIVCSTLFSPVCGSNGVTYGNDCELFRESKCKYNSSVVKVCDGPCFPTTTPCGIVCPPVYQPVCGSDGTYSSDCHLNAEKTCLKPLLYKVHDGICPQTTTPCGSPCLAVYRPVCGSDGVTYGNDCELANAKRCRKPRLYKEYEGPCRPTPPPCDRLCHRIYAPVCGSDGKTYGNQCELDNERRCSTSSVVKVRDGPCFTTTTPCGIVCPPVYQPVCGSDGTYSSDCHLNAERTCLKPSLYKVHNGICHQTTTPCGGPCLAVYRPVCGSDGVTYGNDCELANAKRCRKPRLYKEYEGPCRPTPAPCDRLCHRIYAPVCGSDGKTYDNQCELDNERQCRKPRLYKEYEGPCRPTPAPCDRLCHRIYAPVCGSDGKTYGNQCELDNERRCRNAHLTKSHNGECEGGIGPCDKPCPDHHQPVCGDNDITYDNYCLFEIAQCKWHIGIRESNTPCSSVMKPLASILLTLVAFMGSIFLVLC